jgi:DinB superfamily
LLPSVSPGEYHRGVRWRPDQERCDECGFSWTVPVEEAIALVATAPRRYADLLEEDPPLPVPPPGVWSVKSYLWHMVDVLRIGTERLWTLELDPEAGIPCWDENALAEARCYDRLSLPVGLTALGRAAGEWEEAARRTDTEAVVDHPLFGSLTASDVIRRNAHEAHHHELDIKRGLGARE